jgi:microcin C transport system substrate-binding protein
VIKVEKLDIAPPARMQGYVFNTRRPLFQDRRVREALGYAFDFEWSNKTLFFGQYERITSYFHGEPDLASKGLPGPEELALLEPFRDRLPPEVFSQGVPAAAHRRVGQHPRRPAPGAAPPARGRLGGEGRAC